MLHATNHRIGRFVLWATLSVSSFAHVAMAEPPNTPVSIVLPSDRMGFQPGPGREVAAGFCTICHSADYIYMQPPHAPETWEEIVRKMQRAFGCPIPDDRISTLVAYLVSQNTVQPIPALTHTDSPPSSRHSGNMNMAQGKVIYETYCRNCHGSTGKGDGPIGRALVPRAADLTATVKSDAELLHIIQGGKPGTAMPAWKGELSSDDMRAVLTYIRSLARK